MSSSSSTLTVSASVLLKDGIPSSSTSMERVYCETDSKSSNDIRTTSPVASLTANTPLLLVAASENDSVLLSPSTTVGMKTTDPASTPSETVTE